MKKKGEFKKPRKKTDRPQTPWQKATADMLQKAIDKAEEKHWGKKKK